MNVERNEYEEEKFDFKAQELLFDTTQPSGIENFMHRSSSFQSNRLVIECNHDCIKTRVYSIL